MTTTPPDTLGNPMPFPPPAASVNGVPPQPPPGVEVIDLSPDNDAELQPKWFRIGPRPEDVFCAAPSVPVQFGIDYVKALTAREGDDDTAAERFIGLLRRCLLPGHLERWEARYTDVEHPIDHRTIFRVSDRLLEEWGLRPPRESSDSSDGSPPPDAGTNSEAGSPPPGSTSEPSPSTEDSTSSTPSPSPA